MGFSGFLQRLHKPFPCRPYADEACLELMGTTSEGVDGIKVTRTLQRQKGPQKLRSKLTRRPNIGVALLLGATSLGTVAAQAASAPIERVQVLCADCVGAQFDLAVNPAGDAGFLWTSLELNRRPPARAGIAEADGRFRLTGAPTLLEGFSASNPSVAVGTDGTMVAAWYTGGIQAMVRPPGGQWSAPELIGDGSSPHAAVGPDGTAYVAFRSVSGPVLAERQKAGSWRTESVAGAMTDSAVGVRVGAGADAVVVTWREDAGGDRVRIAAARRVKATWTGVKFLPTRPDTSVPELAVDRRGGAVVVWRDLLTRAGSGPIRAASWQRSEPGWSKIRTLSRSNGAPGRAPTIALDRAGNALAAWRAGGADRSAVRVARRRADTGAWKSPVGVGSGAVRPGGPEVAVGAAGDAVVVWQQARASRRMVVRAAAGSSRTGRFRVAQTVYDRPTVRGPWGLPHESVAAAVDGAGFARIAWYQPTGPGVGDVLAGELETRKAG